MPTPLLPTRRQFTDLAALALPSCLQQATTIHLNKDGSGTLVEETTLGAQASAMLEQMGVQRFVPKGAGLGARVANVSVQVYRQKLGTLRESRTSISPSSRQTRG